MNRRPICCNALVTLSDFGHHCSLYRCHGCGEAHVIDHGCRSNCGCASEITRTPETKP